MLFEELTRSGRLTPAVGMLARDFRAKHGLPLPDQIAFVGSSLGAAIDELASHGIGPFAITKSKPGLWRERGADKDVQVTMGLAVHDGMEIEIFGPGAGTEFYSDLVDPGGRLALHHIAFRVPDAIGAASRMEALGYPVWIRGRVEIAPVRVDFVYVDAREETGLFIEFLASSFLGAASRPNPAVLRAVGTMQKLVRWRG
jgi:hypothetical protein